jgi:hypothetical protein
LHSLLFFYVFYVVQKKSSDVSKKPGLTTPSRTITLDEKGEPVPEKTFSASKFFVPKIPGFDKEFSTPRVESKSQQSGQASGGNHDGIAPLGFSTFGRFSKF